MVVAALSVAGHIAARIAVEYVAGLIHAAGESVVAAMSVAGHVAARITEEAVGDLYAAT